jgi:D-glycero-D-manno-heptose 1,7-bisphosphate phosphatase
LSFALCVLSASIRHPAFENDCDTPFCCIVELLVSTMREKQAYSDAPRQVVILVGGLGTRLGSLTSEIPKPLLDVGGRPFLDYLIKNAIRFGFRDFLLLAGYRAHKVAAYVDAARAFLPAGCVIDFIIEPEPLGTAGAILHAESSLQERFLLLNGDSFLDTNWLDLMVASGSPPPLAVMALRQVEDTSRFGIVTMQDDLITGFAERGSQYGGLINAGVYLIDRQILPYLPQVGSFEQSVLPGLAARGLVRGRTHDGFFLDIGVPAAFADAQTLLPRLNRRAAVFFDRDGTLNVDNGYVHRPEDLAFMPGAVAAIKRVNDLGHYVFVVTNQAGVAHGHYAESDVEAFNMHLQRKLRAAGAHIDEFRYCPDHPEGKVPLYRRISAWRKPNPGMVLDLMDHWQIVRELSLVVGDKESDVHAGQAAGIRSLLYTGSNLDEFLAPHLPPAFQIADY